MESFQERKENENLTKHTSLRMLSNVMKICTYMHVDLFFSHVYDDRRIHKMKKKRDEHNTI